MTKSWDVRLKITVLQYTKNRCIARRPEGQTRATEQIDQFDLHIYILCQRYPDSDVKGQENIKIKNSRYRP